jgi:hypothetical protein
MINNTIEITHRDNRKWIDKFMDPAIAKGYMQLKIPALHAYVNDTYKDHDFIGYYSGDSFNHFTDKSYSFERNETIIKFYPLFFSFTIYELLHLKGTGNNKQLFDDLRNIAIFLDIKCNGKKINNKETILAFQSQVEIMNRALSNEVIKEGVF